MFNIDSTICSACPLYSLHRTPVPGIGPDTADVMLIGEALGATEDKMHEPFVGRSGKLLTQYLQEAGFDRSQLYITNTVKCRPPENATPNAETRKACRAYLRSEIVAVKPKIIVCVGNSALKGVWELGECQLEMPTKFSDARGKMFFHGDYYVLPVFHPSYLLRKHSEDPDSPRGLTRQDFKHLKQIALLLSPTVSDLENLQRLKEKIEAYSSANA